MDTIKFGKFTTFEDYCELQNFEFFVGRYLVLTSFYLNDKVYDLEDVLIRKNDDMYKLKYVSNEDVLNLEIAWNDVMLKNEKGDVINTDKEWEKWNDEWDEAKALKKYKEILKASDLVDEIYGSALDGY